MCDVMRSRANFALPLTQSGHLTADKTTTAVLDTDKTDSGFLTLPLVAVKAVNNRTAN